MASPGLNSTTLRLALGMRGGVSLAVWIGGAVAELDEFRHATGDGKDYYSKLLTVGRYDCVEVDVMSGASAGGLNAVLAASAMIGGKSTDGLQRTWLEVAGLRDLLDSQDGPESRRSLLNGDYFLNKIRLQVEKLLQRTDPPPLTHRLDVFLSATVLNGLPVPIVDDEFSTEDAKRSGALFHFRHQGNADEVSDLVGAATEPLSRAARTTASFPTAFEPVEYYLTTGSVEQRLHGVLQFDGDPRGGFVRLLDGGVVDNIPVARALQGLPNVPAHNATDRWVIYMQPSPDALPIASNSPAGQQVETPMPGIAKVVAGILGGFMSESILDDVELIRQHNLEAFEAWRSWTASIGDLGESDAMDAAGQVAMAQVDVVRITALLLDPQRELVWRPIGVDVPPSPLGVTFANVFRDALATELQSKATVRPFAPIARTAAILTRWARLAEMGRLDAMNQPDGTTVAATTAATAKVQLDDIGAAKREAYQMMHLAQLLSSVIDWQAVSCRPLESPALAQAVAERMSDTGAALVGKAAIVDLIGALPLGDGALSFAINDATFGDLLKKLHKAQVPDGPSGADVVLEAMWEKLAAIAVSLAAFRVPTTGPNSDAILGAFAGKLAKATDKPAAAQTYLRLIDRRTVGVHHGLASGLPGPVKYLRIAGSNLSPLCLTKDQFDFEGPRFTGSLVSRDGSDVPAKLKLSGSDLANFSAFISQRWRENDWMWGRLDAAKSMVDVVCSLDRLPADRTVALELIHQAVIAPMDLPDKIAAEWGESLTDWSTKLWNCYCEPIKGELEQAETADSKERLRMTKRVLVLRRHWEILANELPVYDRADLKPIARENVELGGQVSSPKQDMTKALEDYEQSERSFGAVFGTYWLTALGIRAAYAFWAGTSPRSRLKRWLRSPLKPLPMMLLGTLLARHRGLLALTLAFNVIVSPRVRGIGGGIAIAVGDGIAVALWWSVWRAKETKPAEPPKPARLRAVPAEDHAALLIGLSLAAIAFGVAAHLWPWLYSHLHAQPGWSVLRDWSTLIDYYTLACVAAAAVATVLLWYWAQLGFRLISSVLVGFITGFWTVFSRWNPPPSTDTPWYRRWLSALEFAFGSITWALIVVVSLTTAAAHFAFRNHWPIARYGKDAVPTA